MIQAMSCCYRKINPAKYEQGKVKVEDEPNIVPGNSATGNSAAVLGAFCE